VNVAFLGNFGQGNLGNEATLQAILHHLRRRVPSAKASCICNAPDATSAIHGIPAIPIHALYVSDDFLQRTRLARWFRKIAIGLPLEAYRWIAGFRALRRTDVLIVPGTQFLSDNLTGPFGWPYLALRWAVVAKARGCRLRFVSVGIGPLRHPLSRLFVRIALSLADFRSYRDEPSRACARETGLDTKHDPVYPDLAFSLPAARPNRREGTRRPLVVAVGVKDFHGQYDAPGDRNPDAIYRRYVDELADFVAWLLARAYTVRLVIGDVTYDTQVLAALKAALARRGADSDLSRLRDDPIKSVEALLAYLERSDLVASPRFHNVVLGLLLGKPVMAMAYHEKFAALLDSPQLASLNVAIERLDLGTVTSVFETLEAQREALSRHVRDKVEQHRAALDEQYELIFGESRGRSMRLGVPSVGRSGDEPA
jgi:polysaccharide pyruvyl transferase WcaK-like protein